MAGGVWRLGSILGVSAVLALACSGKTQQKPHSGPGSQPEPGDQTPSPATGGAGAAMPPVPTDAGAPQAASAGSSGQEGGQAGQAASGDLPLPNMTPSPPA